MKLPNKICIFCQTPYRVKPYLLITSKYCSRSCQAKAVRTEITIDCFTCKTPFTHISSRCNKAKYCSRSCYNTAQRNKGKTEFTCSYCLKKFIGHACHKRKYCSRTCVNKKSMKTFKPSFTTVRKMMWTRGLIKVCNRCGFDKEPNILGVHHKDRNKNNNALSNLEVICANCHSIEHCKHMVIHS